MAITPEEAGVSTPRHPRSTTDSDVAYLEKLGYKQELNRSLGLFSAFGVQFTSIAIASGLFTTLIVGLGFFGPASFWSFVVGGALQVFTVGLAVAELVSGYPLAGGVYQITGRITGKPWLAWQTGWWLIIAHTVAVTTVAVAIAPFIAGWFGVSLETPEQTLPWALGLIVAGTLVNVAGVKAAALLNNLGVVADHLCSRHHRCAVDCQAPDPASGIPQRLRRNGHQRPLGGAVHVRDDPACVCDLVVRCHRQRIRRNQGRRQEGAHGIGAG